MACMNAACVCICIGKVYHRCGLRSCVCVFVFALFGLGVCQYASKAIAYALKEKETVRWMIRIVDRMREIATRKTKREIQNICNQLLYAVRSCSEC